MERLIRGRKQFSYATTKVKPLKPRPLNGWHRYAVLGYVSTVFGMMMAVASDLPSLENRAQYDRAENSKLYADDFGCKDLDNEAEETGPRPATSPDHHP